MPSNASDPLPREQVRGGAPLPPTVGVERRVVGRVDVAFVGPAVADKDQAHGLILNHRAAGIEHGDLFNRHSPVRQSFAAVLAWTGGRAVQRGGRSLEAR